MSDLNTNIARVINFADDVRDFIKARGGEVPHGTPVEEYKTKLLELSLGTNVVFGEKELVENGVYFAANDGVDGYNKVVVTVSDQNTEVLNQIITNTAVDFSVPRGVTKLKEYLFYNNKNLKTVEFNDVVEVGAYAFSECFYVNLSLPDSLALVGARAFYYAGREAESFVLNPATPCEIGTYAFCGANLTKVLGKYKNIGDSAFSSCPLVEVNVLECEGVGAGAFSGQTAVSELNIKINGAILSSAFSNMNNLSSCNIDKDSIITVLSTGAFQRFGMMRNVSSSSDIFVLDFRRSTFNQIGNKCFGPAASTPTSTENKYMRIFFPQTLVTINDGAFGYTDNFDLFFMRNIPPILASGGCFTGSTNLRIFAPFGAVNVYRNTTNWVVQSPYIKGFAQSGHFDQGRNLPSYSVEGYALTWYSDLDMTSRAFVVEDDEAEYYCNVGTEKVAHGVQSISTKGCGVVISDGSHTYYEGDGILAGEIVTITLTPDHENYIPLRCTINGVGFTSGDSIEVTDDLDIVAIYSDGQNFSVDPVFANNPWAIIFEAFKNGASEVWSVGDEKPITLITGETYTIRIADAQKGRYSFVDGGLSNGVLEFKELYSTQYYMNYGTSSSSNYGGWDVCYMKNTVMPIIYSLLPRDLRNEIKETFVPSGRGSANATIIDSGVNNLFLPAQWEMFGVRGDAQHGEAEGAPQFDYYKNNNVNETRIKYNNGAAARTYWLRSASYYQGMFCAVSLNGDASMSGARFLMEIAPCFAV